MVNQFENNFSFGILVLFYKFHLGTNCSVFSEDEVFCSLGNNLDFEERSCCNQNQGNDDDNDSDENDDENDEEGCDNDCENTTFAVMLKK